MGVTTLAMVFKRRDLPEVGELVIARVKRIIPQGAYADLLEFENLDAFIPWSEISTRYFRDVREVLREGQIVVGKVIRVDKKKRPPQIDISIKRVSEGERRVRIMRWKRDQKAQKIIELAAKKAGLDLEEAYRKLWVPLYTKFRDVLSLLEDSVLKGPEVLMSAGIPEDLAKIVWEEARRHIEIRKVKIAGLLILRCYKPDGVHRIKKLLIELENSIPRDEHTSLRIISVGSPRYRIDIVSTDYKKAEKILSELVEKARELAKELEIDEFDFKREEVSRA